MNAKEKGAVVELVTASRAIELLIAEHGELVFHLIYGLTGDWEESEDLTQETFLHTLHAFDAARQASGEQFHAKAWLIRIAVNSARMSLRRRRLIRFDAFSRLEQNETTEQEG
jgi:RNA polymerase sigma factor (sigma-70 family)